MLTLFSVVAFTVAAFTLSGAIVKARGASMRNRRFLSAAMIFGAISLATTAPETLSPLPPLSPYFSLLCQTAAVSSLAWAYCLVRVLSGDRPSARAGSRRGGRVVMGLVLAVACAGLVAVHVATFWPTVVASVVPVRPVLCVGWVALNVAVLLVVSRFAWLVRLRVLAKGAQVSLRRSGVSTVVGAGLGVAWVGLKCGLAISLIGGDWSAAMPTTAALLACNVLAVLAVGVSSAGASLPGWQAILQDVIRSRRDRSTFRRLQPMWTLVTGVVPEVRLGGAVGAVPGVRRADVSARLLYRRIVEIRDAQAVLLSRWPQRPATDDADGAVDDPGGIRREAGALTAAIAAHRSGTAVAEDARPDGARARITDSVPIVPAAEEARRLLGVWRAVGASSGS